jgi:hypothetical protein
VSGLCGGVLGSQLTPAPRELEAAALHLVDDSGSVLARLEIKEVAYPQSVVYDDDGQVVASDSTRHTYARLEFLNHRGEVVWEAPQELRAIPLSAR